MSCSFKQEKPRGSKSNKLGDMSSVQFGCHSVTSDSLWPHRLQHTRPPCPSLTSGACSNSCPLSLWCHSTISSSVVPFSPCFQSFPASGSFPMSQFFASCGQSIRVSASASVLPMNIQNWFPIGWADWISLQSKGLSRVFSNTAVQKHQFFVSGGQSIGISASASVLLMNIQDWFPLGLTESKGLSWVFSNTTVQKHQFFSTQPSL